MNGSMGVKGLSSQVVSEPMGQKTKPNTSLLTAFGMILNGTVNKSTKLLLNQSGQQLSGKSLEALKQQLTQAVGDLNEESPPLSAENAQLKGMIEQLLKKLDGQSGENGSIQKTSASLLKNLGEALGKKQLETKSDQQDSPWGQLLATIQNIIFQGRPLLQKVSGEGAFPEGDKLKATALAETNQVTPSQQMTATTGMKATDLSNKRLQPMLDKNKGEIQSVPLVSSKAAQGTNSFEAAKTPNVTKVTGVKLFPEKPKSEDPNGKTGLDVSALMTGGRPMNKVQQLLFHQLSAPAQSPADQIANQIKVWMSQGALKSTDGQLSMNLNLHPDNLGAVQLAITQTDGGLSASITAHSGLTKDLIESQLNHLQQALSASGIAVYKIDVSVAQTPSGTSDPTYQPPQDQGQGRNTDHHQSTPQEQAKEGPEFEKWLEEGLDV